MIKPTRVTVTRYGRRPATRSYWLHFDTAVLVDLRPELARELVYDLAATVGLAVFPSDRYAARILRRLRTAVRNTFSRRRSSHARW
ncbi:hypothetical protein AB8O64_19685 [Streptomyces sp. QH1-20]|uniref:hypothetical protein n=1 Tax=Streptomyces sp. QH1-20 TaxID=3240934 RepID=UPI0035157BD2